MKAELKGLIETNYGFEIGVVRPGPRQWVGETYRIETRDGQPYFVKLIRHPRFKDRPKPGLPVVRQLFEKGFKQIGYPIAAKDGRLFLEQDGCLLIVFNFIEGQLTDEFDLGHFGELNARLHQFTPELTVAIQKESFEPLYAARFLPVFERALTYSGQDNIAQRMRVFIKPYEAEVRQEWETFLNLGRQCQASQFEFVITHGDAPFNIMQDRAGALYLVDWDEVLLAPAERDTWFQADRPAFLAGYRRVCPGYELNRLAYRYYVYYRYGEELMEYLDEIMGDKAAEQRENSLAWLDRAWFRWLRPMVRELSSSWS